MDNPIMYSFMMWYKDNPISEGSFRVLYRLVKDFEKKKCPNKMFDKLLMFERTECYNLARLTFDLIESIDLGEEFVAYKNNQNDQH